MHSIYFNAEEMIAGYWSGRKEDDSKSYAKTIGHIQALLPFRPLDTWTRHSPAPEM
jgi:hypothetical protein